MAKKIRFRDYFYIMRFMKPRMGMYLAGLLGHSINDAYIMVMIPFLMKFMIDAAVKGNVSQLKQGMWMAGSQAVIISLIFVATGSFLRRSINRTVTEIRTTLFSHIQSLPVSYFEQNHSGDILSRVSNDLNAVLDVIGWELRAAIFIILSGIGSTVAMMLLDWKLGLVLVTVGTLASVVNSKYAALLKRTSEQIQKALGRLTEKMSDVFAGLSVIKIFHLQKNVLAEFQIQNQAVFELEMAKVRKAGQLDCINFTISWFNFGGIIALGALLFVKGKAEFGTVIALTHLLGSMNFMVRRLGGTLAHLQSCMAGVRRVIELLEVEGEPERYPVGAATGSEMIVFEGVKFAYRQEQPVLNQVNLAVGEGKIAALVGASGGGKSTIVKLLLGFYPPTGGNISIRGRGMEHYTLDELRSMMTYVPQDAYLFDGTIEENIRYGRPTATQEELYAAARAANAHSFITQLPEAYQSVVGERGIRLSGGQRQRIAIARAILKDAPILLLDEATSSLDSQSEQQVQEALATLMQGKTVIVVAHRLSTIRNADIIYVIDQGTVAEAGKHEALLEKDGLYTRLHQLQFVVEKGQIA